jgi:transmembrane sensor
MPHFSSPESPHAEATRWVAQRRGGDCSPEEQRAFLRWLNADKANGKAYAQAENLWQQLGGLDTIADRQLHEARAYLAQKRRKSFRRSMIGFALAASLVAVAWQADWLSYLNDQSYRTALGERKSVMLADGSRVDINTGSEVAVHYSRRGRELRLIRGQAAFAVAHNDTRPFDVLAEKMRIRDIGTQFDVRQRADRVEVSVLEGNVEVSARDGAAVQPLRQGQRLSYSAAGDTTAIESIDINAAGAWRDGRIVFKSQPLGEVLAELGRYHTASVAVTSPRILTIKVSGAVPSGDLELALTTIAATLPAKLTRTGPQSWRIDG